MSSRKIKNETTINKKISYIKKSLKNTEYEIFLILVHSVIILMI